MVVVKPEIQGVSGGGQSLKPVPKGLKEWGKRAKDPGASEDYPPHKLTTK